MSKEVLISLLENGIKKTLDILNDSQTNEMNTLKLLSDQMESIKKTYGECSELKGKLIGIIKENEEKNEKKLSKSKTVAHLSSQRQGKGNKSQGSLLNDSSVAKKHQPLNTEGNNKASASFLGSSSKKTLLKGSKTEKIIPTFNTEDKGGKTKAKVTQSVKANSERNNKDSKAGKALNSKGVKGKGKVNYYNLIEKHWSKISSFLSERDQHVLGSYSKKLSKLYFDSVIAKTKSELDLVTKKQSEIIEKYLQEDIDKKIAPFVYSKVTAKVFALLNEDTYSSLFANSSQRKAIPFPDVLNVYKVFFQLINTTKEKEVLNSKDNTEFWMKACDYFSSLSTETSKLGSSLDQLFTISLDFTEENAHAIFKLVHPIIATLTPLNFQTKCQTTSLFFFLIKDPLEYMGFLSDKKTQPSLMHKYTSFIIKQNKARLDKLASIKPKLIK